MERSAVDREDLKPHWRSEKKTTFLEVVKNPIIYKFLKDLTNHRKKNNMVVVFNCRPFPDTLKYKDHYETFQQKDWKTRFLKTLIKEFSYYVRTFRLTVF